MATIKVSALTALPVADATYTYGITDAGTEGKVPIGGTDGLAGLASPTFTGTPAAPTAVAGTSTTQLATTAFVSTGFAPLTGGTTDPVIHVNVNNDLVNVGPDNNSNVAVSVHIFSPATDLASLRFSFDEPFVAGASVADGGQIMVFTFTKNITAITYVGGFPFSASALAAPTSATAGDVFQFAWIAATQEWARFL